MRDMMEKYGTQVESFRYAFVLPNHMPGWDQPLPQTPASQMQKQEMQKQVSLPSMLPQHKSPTFIEIKPRQV